MNTDNGLPPLLVLLLAPTAGALVTLSLAPFKLWPLGILSCAIYAYLLCTCRPGQAFWRGWLYGLGLFGSGVSWVFVSIHVYGYASVPLAAGLTALFCMALALFHALFAWVYVVFIRRLPGGMLMGFPVLWVLFEWLRSWMFTGFPWLYLGYAHIHTWIAGWAPVLGVFALSFICALTGTCLFLGWRSRQPIAWLTYTIIVISLWGGGAALKPTVWVARASEEPLSVALIQPNVPQEHKWNPAWYPTILAQLEELTRPQFGRDIIIWPEAAIPGYLQRAESFLEPLAQRASNSETTLITGVPYRTDSGVQHNSIIAVGHGSGVYHKQRLVPFGEYVPLEQWLRGLITFFDLPMSSFSPGAANQTPLRVGAYRAAPFICYEIVYANLVSKAARDTDLIITISNDSWFGDSIGPLQHMQIAQMRALENGRHVLRGTNNGISAIIDHQGRIVKKTDQFVTTTLVGPVNVMLGNTPFGSFGTTPIIAGAWITLLLMYLMYLGFWRDTEPD
jgi:apolipoprotein N-acyltransferase